VSGWGRNIDDLAAAAAELLTSGSPRTQPLVDPHAALAARDAVLVELRGLVGAVADAPRFSPVRELTVYDVVHRPAQALHQTLSELPRALPFGAVELGSVKDKTLPDYERAWQRAARSATALEGYVDGVGRLPDQHAWDVLRDLTDIAAALRWLDHDLSEALLPGLKSGEDLGVAYRMLTHAGHEALRVVAVEVRARVPAAEPVARAARAPDDPPDLTRPAAGTGPLAQVAPRPPRTSAAGPGNPPAGQDRPLLARGPAAPQELSEAMVRFAHAVSARGATLSVPDLRAASRVLEFGCAYAASVLDRAAPALSGAGEVALGLQAVTPLARQLREEPVKSMTLEHLDLMQAGTQLQARMKALAGQATRLPGGAAEHDLRRLAAPALEFAQHVPALAGALDLSVREAVAAGLMLIRGSTGEHRTATIGWVTASMGPGRDGPPHVVAAAGTLSTTARRVAPAVRRAGEELMRHAAAPPTPAQQALIAARRHAGAARVELRTALADRSARQPGSFTAELPSHPALAPPPRAAGPHR
jgi:hypothetical protein